MKALRKKHPLATRWFHWINFPLLTLMIFSGALIYWANPVYRIGFGSHTLLRMTMPQPWYQKIHMNARLAEGMSWHFFFMWLFAINGVAYVVYSVLSGEAKLLLPNRHSFREAFEVVLHDLGIRKEPLPDRKFNAAQQFAYTGVVLMGLGSLVTGLAIYKPVQFAWLTALCGGYQMARFIHFWLTIGYVLFFVVHVGQVVRAGWNNFRAMLTGSELVEREPAVPREAVAAGSSHE